MRKIVVLLLMMAVGFGLTAQNSTYKYTFGCETFKGKTNGQTKVLNGKTVKFYQMASPSTYGNCVFNDGLYIEQPTKSPYTANYALAITFDQCTVVSATIDMESTGTGTLYCRDFVESEYLKTTSIYVEQGQSQIVSTGIKTFLFSNMPVNGIVFGFEVQADVRIKSISYEYIDANNETHYILYDRGVVVGEMGVTAADEPCSFEYNVIPDYSEDFIFAGWTAEDTNAGSQNVTLYDGTDSQVSEYHAVYEHKVLGASLKEYLYTTNDGTLSPAAPSGVTVSGITTSSFTQNVEQILEFSSNSPMVVSDISLHASLSATSTTRDELSLMLGDDVLYSGMFFSIGMVKNKYYDFEYFNRFFVNFDISNTFKIKVNPYNKTITCDAIRFAMGPAANVESRYYNHPEDIETYRRLNVALDESAEELEEVVTLRDGLEVVKRVDDSRYYFFSLPFDCAFDHISFRHVAGPVVDSYYSGVNDNAYIGDWVISRYREDLAANGQSGWEDMTLSELQQNGLQKNVGYLMGIVPSGAVTDVKFRSAQNLEVKAPETVTLSTQYTQTSQTAKYKGWNLVGNPYYQGVDYKNLNVNYILAPKSNGQYKVCHRYAEGYTTDYEIKPFSSYFVQRTAADAVTMTPAAASSIKAAEQTIQHFNIVVEKDSSMDYTTVLIGDDYSVDYETGADLLKMTAESDEPEIYTILDDSPMAVNAQPFQIGDVIPLSFYIPKRAEYTIRIGENIYLEDGLTVALYDKNENVLTDLLESEYKFTRNKGTANNRFEIRILARTALEDLKNPENIVFSRDSRIVVKTDAEEVVIFDVNGKEVERSMTENGAFESKELSKGIYVVRISDSAEKCVVY